MGQDWFFIELCGGIYVVWIGDIGVFWIILEIGVVAGICRIEVVSGQVVMDWIDVMEDMVDVIFSLLKINWEQVFE